MLRPIGDNWVVEIKINTRRVIDFCSPNQVFFLLDAILNKTVRFCFVFEGIYEFYVVKNEFNNAFPINFGFVKMTTRAKFDA